MARDQDDLEETPAHAESGEGASGAPAQGPGAQADGERAVISRDVSGTIVTGDVTPVTAATPGPDEPPTLDVVLAQLRRLADAVRPAPGEPTQAGLDVVLQRLEREIALLDGRPVPLDALNAVRALVAGGVAG
ncbi:MAG: hypothetical protein RMN25_11325, partial [Anaerolineae bacterium]|nr:hypothetical protein [Thermoflexales bacterium]MDW8408360.1 hypothetical protein [Anaerolineae bacterium]